MQILLVAEVGDTDTKKSVLPVIQEFLTQTVNIHLKQNLPPGLKQKKWTDLFLH